MDIIQKRKREIEARLNFISKQQETSKIPKAVPDKSHQFLNKVFGKRGVSKTGSSIPVSSGLGSTISVESISAPSSSSCGSNAFSNDGSFLEQFRKLSEKAKSGQEPKIVPKAVPVFPAYSSNTEITETIRKFAERVANEGDTLEDKMRSQTYGTNELMFLHDPTSSLYLSYRRLVNSLRNSFIDVKPPISEIKREYTTQGQRSAPMLIKAEVKPSVSEIKREYSSQGQKNAPMFVKEEVKPFSDMKKEYSSQSQKSAPAFVKAETSFQVKQEPIFQVKQESKFTTSEQPESKRSRWGPPPAEQKFALPPPGIVSITSLGAGPTIITPIVENRPLLSKVTNSDPEVLQYAMRVFGTTDLEDAQWKQCTDQLKMQYVYQELRKKKADQERLERAGKVKYEYDSDEEVEGGTWEHKRRLAEMEKTRKIAEELTEKSAGKHHIGDFLPPDELAKFTAKYNGLKSGQKMDLSDFEEFKIADSNVGFKMLQKLGWTEGKGLGSAGTGITAPVNMNARSDNHGLGVEKPGELDPDDDEFDSYRKKMMLAYRFRPNPLNNPRRAYY